MQYARYKNNRIVTVESIPPTSTYQETSTPLKSVGHSDGVQQYKEKNELKKMTLKQKNYCKIFSKTTLTAKLISTSSSTTKILFFVDLLLLFVNLLVFVIAIIVACYCIFKRHIIIMSAISIHFKNYLWSLFCCLQVLLQYCQEGTSFQ